MDLKDFVKESIVQISKGIEEANSELEESDAMVNPINVKMHSMGAKGYGRTTRKKEDNSQVADSKLLQNLEFDVAVTVEAGKQGSAGAKLSIATFNVGAAGKIESTDRSESRIRFTIPVVFPGFNNQS